MIPLIVFGTAAIMFLVERRAPGRSLPRVAGWWGRAALLNAVQAAVAYLVASTWDRWLGAHRPWSLELGTLAEAAIGYGAITFIYYWWHRWRHEVPVLWRHVHQIHHSPRRLEVITSFYKHPLEVVVNGFLSSSILFLLVGASPAAVANAVLVTGLAELFYHWNVKTPHWLGYVVQRPESHRVHHQQGFHALNYSDLPIWDMVFGTFRNPRTRDVRCGFAAGEGRLREMLRGVDVQTTPAAEGTRLPGARTVLATMLLIIGLGAMFGDLIGSSGLRGVAGATMLSPAPRVFSSVQGLETYSSRFFIEWTDVDGVRHEVELTPETSGCLRGPYNRRNVYGAALAYGPVLARTEATRPMFESVLSHALTGEAPVLREMGIDPVRVAGPVVVRCEPLAGTDVAGFPLVFEAGAGR